MGKAEKKKRFHYLINKKFQLKYAATAFVLMFLVAVVLIITAYYSGWVPLVEKLSAVYPQGMLTIILRRLIWQLAAAFLFLVPVIIVASIYLSHKIAGPLVRIEKAARDIAGGNLQIRVKLRKKDSLQKLAQAINDITESVGQMVEKNRRLIKEKKKILSGLTKLLERQKRESPETKVLIAQLDKCINDANESLSNFKTRAF